MDLWKAALAELQKTTTTATFNTWLADTHAARRDGNLTIYSPSAFGADMLANQYRAKIQAVVDQIAGRPLELSFAVHRPQDKADRIPTEAGDIFVTLLELPTEPFIKVAKYAIWFWQPLLGCIPFAVYNMLRTQDHFTAVYWGKRHRINTRTIAETLGINRQQVTGIQRKRGGRKIWIPGAFDVINQAHIGRIDPHGQNKNIVYTARILNTLPLLTPAQVATLTPLLQERHRNHLKMFDFDSDRWAQLTLDNLIEAL